MEKSRHVLLVREKLLEQQRTHELNKLDKNALNRYRRHGHVTTPLSDKERQRSISEMEKSTDELKALDSDVMVADGDRGMALMVKCLRLMLHSRTETRAKLMAVVRPLALLLVCSQ